MKILNNRNFALSRIIFYFISILCLISCNNQIENKDEVPLSKLDSFKIKRKSQEQEYLKDSIQYASIKRFIITKIEGKHKYRGKTYIEYKSLHQLLKNIKLEAKNEMWTNEKLDEKIKIYKKDFRGGMLILHVDRETIGHANMEEFTLIVKSSKDEEIMRYTFGYDAPEIPNGDDFWWNIGGKNIPTKVDYPFYVYVIDGLTSDKFKFEIKPAK